MILWAVPCTLFVSLSCFPIGIRQNAEQSGVEWSGAEWICRADQNGDINRAYLRISDYCRVRARARARVRVRVVDCCI